MCECDASSELPRGAVRAACGHAHSETQTRPVRRAQSAPQ